MASDLYDFDKCINKVIKMFVKYPNVDAENIIKYLNSTVPRGLNVFSSNMCLA